MLFERQSLHAALFLRGLVSVAILAHSLRLTVIHAIAWCISSMAACYSSLYLDRLWTLLFEDSGVEAAAELNHGVRLSDVLAELVDPPAHAPVCAEPPEDSLAADSAQGSDGAAAERAAEGPVAVVHDPVLAYEPERSQTQSCVKEPGKQPAEDDFEPGLTLFHMWSMEPQEPETPDSQDTLKLQLQEEGRKQAKSLHERIAEEEAASKRARLSHACLEDALDNVFLQEDLCLRDGLPITFEEAVFDRHLFQEDALQDCEVEAFYRIGNCLPALYVGACHSPSFRWKGGFIEGRGKMDGHCKHATQMHVLAARLGKLGKTAEEALIKYAKSRFGEKCTNKSWKSIGIKAEPTDIIFLYVVYSLLHNDLCF